MVRIILELLAVVAMVSDSALGGEVAEGLEEEMFKLVNEDRLEEKLPPLSLDEKLRGIARAHSEDMASNHFCGHESFDGRTLFDRIYRGGIWASAFAENVAKDTSIASAEDALMHSEGHRKNLLDSNYTHVGIGVVKGDSGYIYVTQDFIRKVEKVQEEKAEREIYERINAERQKRGDRPLLLDSNLTMLAWKNSLMMVEKEEVKLLCPGLGEYRGVFFAYRITDLEEILNDNNLLTAEGSRIGIGLLQRDSRKYGKGMLWVTIVIAE